MTAILKKNLGEAGAFFDESSGQPNRLYEVLKALAESAGQKVEVFSAAPTAIVLTSRIADRAGFVSKFALALGTTGSAAGPTVITLSVAGTVVATLSIAQTEANGTRKVATFDEVAVAEGDVVEIEATGVSTGAANLDASTTISPVSIE